MYESDLEGNSNFTFLLSEPPRRLNFLHASDIMCGNVVCVREVEEASVLAKVLHSTEHNGFPVVRYDENGGGGAYLQGFVLRHQLLVLLERAVELASTQSPLAGSPGSDNGSGANAAAAAAAAAAADDDVNVPLLTEQGSRDGGYEAVNGGYTHAELVALELQMRTFHSRRNRHGRHFARVATPRAWALTHDDDGIDDSDESDRGSGGGGGGVTPRSAPPQRWIDLRPFLARAPLTVRAESRASSVHELFSKLSLRHLVVTDGCNQVLGIVTRKDLDVAQGEGWWRMAPSPTGV